MQGLNGITVDGHDSWWYVMKEYKGNSISIITCPTESEAKRIGREIAKVLNVPFIEKEENI